MSLTRSAHSVQELRLLIAQLERRGLAASHPEARALLERSRALLRRQRPPPRRLAGSASWESVAVYAGAQGIANGLDLVLEAARLLAARGEARVRIALVGEGGETPRLKARAAEWGLPNLVFVPPLPKADLAALLE